MRGGTFTTLSSSRNRHRGSSHGQRSAGGGDPDLRGVRSVTPPRNRRAQLSQRPVTTPTVPPGAIRRVPMAPTVTPTEARARALPESGGYLTATMASWRHLNPGWMGSAISNGVGVRVIDTRRQSLSSRRTVRRRLSSTPGQPGGPQPSVRRSSRHRCPWCDDVEADDLTLTLAVRRGGDHGRGVPHPTALRHPLGEGVDSQIAKRSQVAMHSQIPSRTRQTSSCSISLIQRLWIETL
jgi:hypothetical protein